MRIESIDFKQKTIFNPFGKTKAARRTIPMTDDVACLLKARIKKLERKKDRSCFRRSTISKSRSGAPKRRTGRLPATPESRASFACMICATHSRRERLPRTPICQP
jgi:integrase